MYIPRQLKYIIYIIYMENPVKYLKLTLIIKLTLTFMNLSVN